MNLTKLIYLNIFFVIFVLNFSLLSKADVNVLIPHIVGGVPAVSSDFSFIVSIQTNQEHFCGGSLVRSNWVLTAAHCVVHAKANNIEVYAGADRLDNPNFGERIAVQKIILHPAFGIKNDRDADFALLKLVRHSHFKPIPMQSELPIISGLETVTPKATIAGWGALIEDGMTTVFLRRVDVPLVSHRLCKATYPQWYTENMMCAGYVNGGSDSCQGDSGGPLIIKFGTYRAALIGVVSWGTGCGRRQNYGVYARLGAAANWIKNIIDHY